MYDYVPGKADWFAAGLPRAGQRASIPRAGDAAERNVATCGLADRVGDAAERVRETGGRSCLVITPGRVVLGRLDERALAGDPEATAEAAMTPGPLTIRPDRLLDAAESRFRDRGLDEVAVTTSDGVLAGLLRIGDVEPSQEEGEASCDCGA